MAKDTKSAQPAKAAKAAKPFLKSGTKRKGEGQSSAAPPAKRARDENGKSPDGERQKKLHTKDKRAVIREKKLQHKKNWNVIQDSVYLWEKLRPKDTSDIERRELVSNILKKVKGKLLELSNHHTASRVIQFCVKYGGDVERRTVMDEVRANVVELSKSKYGHFLVRKLINTAKKDEVPGLVRLFRGHVAQLLRQPYGADVITDLYDVASTADRNALCSEFYGKEFVLFDGISGEAGRLYSLKQLMTNSPAAKQRAIIQHMTKALTPIVEKALLDPPITHRLVKEYLECATGLSVEEAVETLSQTGEAVLRMVHTHEGAAAACMVLAYGMPRDRKRVVRAMKGHVAAMAADEWGHTVLCMALACVDDTSLTSKVVVSELKELLQEGVHQPNAVRVLHQLLSPDCRRHFPPAIYEMLHPPQRVVRGSTGKSVTDLEGEEDEEMDFGGAVPEDDADEDGGELFSKEAKGKSSNKPKARGKVLATGADEDMEDPADKTGNGGTAEVEGVPNETDDAAAERVLGASKKDPRLRRRELLGSGPKSLSVKLTQVVAAEAPALLRSPHSCELVVEVARGGESGLLFELEPDGVRSVHAAIIEDAARSPEDVAAEAGVEEDAPEAPSTSGREHVLLSYYSSRALRRLLLLAADEQPAGAAGAFASEIWANALKGRCKQWVGTHAEKVLVALLQCGVQPVVTAATKELKPLVKQPLEEWAGRFLGQKGKEGDKQVESRLEQGAEQATQGKVEGRNGKSDGKQSGAAEAGKQRGGLKEPKMKSGGKDKRVGAGLDKGKVIKVKR
ncbi:pumilio family protein [Volvox carteri f. nagariensis]|uniref:Pumilio family protein n=1 Tax=Volvox carteri f. nagariensis TaxID=3068 RepID=D8U4B0_VOLCA|eukprot:XP_002953398.1 pumilio family protein [Volvox carteri f. nagariensis]